METESLVLRRWRDEDAEPFAALNADPVVMRYMLAPLDRGSSDQLLQRLEDHFDRHGFGLWALELRSSGEFIGFTGLSVPRFSAPFTPCVEVGWRLARRAWGFGYATEAAGASLTDGFARADLTEIVSFTARDNAPSRAVMRRLKMTHDRADDFEHPNIEPGHPLRPHVLYRLTRSRWDSIESRARQAQ